MRANGWGGERVGAGGVSRATPGAEGLGASRSWARWGLLGAMLLSLAWQGLLAMRNHIPDYDEAVFFDLASGIARTGLPYRSLADGNLYLFHPPLFAYLLGGAFLIFGEGLLVARLLSSALSVLTLGLTFLLGREVGDERAGAVAALLLALNPLFLVYSFSAYMEITLTLVMVASLYFFVRAERQGRGYLYLAAGSLLGLALVTKYLAVIGVLAYGGYLLAKHRGRALFRRELYLVMLPAGGLFLLWLAYALALDARLFLGQTADWLEQRPWDARVSVGVWAFLGAAMGAAEPVFSLAFALCLVRHLFGPKSPSAWVPLAYVAATGIVLVAMSIKDVRYMVPLLPVVAVLVASAIPWPALLAWLGRQSRPGRLAFGAGALLALALVSPLDFIQRPRADWLASPRFLVPVFEGRLRSDENQEGLKLAGVYLSHNSLKGDAFAITYNGPVVAHYAGRRYRLLYVQSYAEALRTLEAVNFVLIEPGGYGIQGLPRLSAEERVALERFIKSRFAPTAAFGPEGQQVRLYARRSGPTSYWDRLGYGSAEGAG